jgi:biotin carboxyl carrier protein
MKYYTRVSEREREFTFERQGEQFIAHTNGKSYRLDMSMVGDGNAFSLFVDGRSYDVIVDAREGCTNVLVDGETVKVYVEDERERTASAVASARPVGKRTLKSSMPGIVVEIQVAVGDVVEDGQTLLILEAMKMQNPIQAEGSGTIAEIHVSEGDAIASGTALVDLDG